MTLADATRKLSELGTRLTRRSAAGVVGTPFLKAKNISHPVWVDRYKIGTEQRERLIGSDSPHIRDRLARFASTDLDFSGEKKNRCDLVRDIRAAGFAGPSPAQGALMSALSRAQAFESGVTLIGWEALRAYGVLFGPDWARLMHPGLEPVTIAMPDELSDEAEAAMGELDFDLTFDAQSNPRWRWQQSGTQEHVAIVTTSLSEDMGVRGVGFLLKGSMRVPLLHADGCFIRVPTPVRFALHQIAVGARQKGTAQEKTFLMARVIIERVGVQAADRIIDGLVEIEDREPEMKLAIEDARRMTREIDSILP